MGSPGLDYCCSHIVSKWFPEEKKAVPPPPELQSCPPEWLWTRYGLICVRSTPGPSSPKWLQMNETKAQSKETQPHVHPPTRQHQRRMPWGGARGGRIRATSALAIHLPLPALRPTRGFSAPSPPRPLRALLTRSQLGLPMLPAEGTSSRAGTGSGTEPAAAATPGPQPLESLLGVSPRPRQGSRSPGPSRGRRPPRPLPAALQHGPGSAAEDGSVRAEGGVSPPARPAARRSLFTAAPRPALPPAALRAPDIIHSLTPSPAHSISKQ